MDKFFISVLGVVIGMYNQFYPSSIKDYIWVLTAILLIIACIRWWIEYQPLKLINEYNSLMKFLGELSCMNSKSNQLISGAKNPSFELMQRNVDRKYNRLNTKVLKLRSIPYRILWSDIALVKLEFIELVEDTKILFEEFTWVGYNCNVNYDTVKKEYNIFIYQLELSRKKYPNEIPEHLITPISLEYHYPEGSRWG
ncbi:MAG: hypothetical protein WA130_10640 [Candidatus Methanoperedens sp.]